MRSKASQACEVCRIARKKVSNFWFLAPLAMQLIIIKVRLRQKPSGSALRTVRETGSRMQPRGLRSSSDCEALF